VLATQLATAMHARALIDSRLLPAAARPAFTGGFSRAAKSGLQVGRGQSAASLPNGTPAPQPRTAHRGNRLSYHPVNPQNQKLEGLLS